MGEKFDEWLERISTGEESLKRMRREIAEDERASGLTKAEERKAIEGLNKMAEDAKNSQEYAPIDDSVDEDDDPINEAEREEERQAIRELEEHSEEVLTEYHVPILRKNGIKEGGKVSGKIKESRITEPARHKIRDVKDGMTMVGPGIWLPGKLAESGSGDEILEYMQENKIGLK